MCREGQKFDYCESFAFVYFPQHYIFFMAYYSISIEAVLWCEEEWGWLAMLLIKTLCHGRDETLAHHNLRFILIAPLQLLLTVTERSSENSSIGMGLFYSRGQVCVVLLWIYINGNYYWQLQLHVDVIWNHPVGELNRHNRYSLVILA